MRRLMTMLGVLILTASVCNATPPSKFQDRWVFWEGELGDDASLQKTVALLERAAKDGFNGLALGGDFLNWETLGPAPEAANVRKVREACRRLGMKFIPGVFDLGMGHHGVLISDPNLASGLPVTNAPFVVRNGALVPAEDRARILNGGFEDYKGNEPAGWHVDMPGKISFIDTGVKYEGKPSLRMQDIGANDPEHGHGRISQPLKLRPFGYYHLSFAVKTQDFEAAGQVRVEVLATGGPGVKPGVFWAEGGEAAATPAEVGLNFLYPRILKTQDWRRVDIAFDSLEFSEATLYIGVWGGKGGKIWLADVRMEPGGLVNVLRRDGTPLKVTSEDGKTVYKEGADFGVVRDPRLGNDSYRGSFTVWHQPPVVPVPPGSALKEGQKVLFSYYYPPRIHRTQVNSCLSDPKVYDLLKAEAEQTRLFDPDGYFMQHDEMRCDGWDEDCARMKMTPGQLLAYNVKRCVDILHSVDPGKPIYVWSDMFDPNDNALKVGRYYLVKGEGPWYGSWEGLPKEVIMINWLNWSTRAKAMESLKFFSGRGQKQILSCCYDDGPARIRPWLEQGAQVEGVIGAMYTTWIDRYDDLEKFTAEIASVSACAAGETR